MCADRSSRHSTDTQSTSNLIDTDNPVRLSVSLVTYQELGFIRQAIDSVLHQQTDFPFELVVGDDASTDGSQKILKELAGQYPDKVKLLLAEKNYGDFGLSNFMSTIDNCEGEYVALLDGDDYWTATDKLQRQVDFLDAHPECDLCVHRVEHVSDDGFSNLSPLPPGGEGMHSVHDIGTLLVENFGDKIATVIRKSAIDSVPDWFRTTQVASADWVFNVLACRNGKVGFISEVMAVHRKRSMSLTAYYGANRMLRDKLGALDTLRPYFPAHESSLRKAARKIRWKLRIARLGPGPYEYMRRLAGRHK